jgi:hypothetical protein
MSILVYLCPWDQSLKYQEEREYAPAPYLTRWSTLRPSSYITIPLSWCVSPCVSRCIPTHESTYVTQEYIYLHNTYMSIYVHPWPYTHVRSFTHKTALVPRHTHTYRPKCAYMSLHPHMYIYTYIQTQVHISHIHIYIHTWSYTHIYHQHTTWGGTTMMLWGLKV